MNIAIDIRGLVGAKTSGVTVYMNHLIRQLSAMEGQNSYFYYANSKRKLTVEEKEGLPKDRLIETIIPNKILNFSLSFFSRPRLDRLIWSKIKKPIDLFFMPDLRPCSLSPGVKKVITVHDLSFKRFPQYFSYKTRLWHKLLSPKRELTTADHLIAVSEFTKKELQAVYKIPEEKISVIYHGVNFKTVNPQLLDQVRSKYNLPSHFILTLSTIEPRKNLPGLIKAMNFLQKKEGINLPLVIVGTENPAIFRSPFLENVNYVKRLGFVSEEEKAALYTLAELFIYPSFYEGFGLPVLEAMSFGCPVVVAKGSALEEVAGEMAILFDPHDPLSMAEAIEIALRKGKDLGFTKELKKRAQLFSWEKCASEVQAVFEKVILLRF